MKAPSRVRPYAEELKIDAMELAIEINKLFCEALLSFDLAACPSDHELAAVIEANLRRRDWRKANNGGHSPKD